MPKKLNNVENKKIPTSITLYQFIYDTNEWTEMCKIVWKNNVWQVEGEITKESSWILYFFDNGKEYDDKLYKPTDRDFYIPLIYSSGSMYSFVADD